MTEKGNLFKYSTPFTMISNELLMCEYMSPILKTIYCVACCYANSQNSSCYPSYVTIAQKASVSRRTAINAIKTLEDAGLIEKEIRKNGDEYTSNVYTIYPWNENAEMYFKNTFGGSNETVTSPSAGDAPPSAGDALPPSAGDTPPSAGDAPELYSLNNNHSFNKNQSVSQQRTVELPESANLSDQTEGQNKEKILYITRGELLDGKTLPYWYAKDFSRMTEAIHFMTEWDTFYPNGYKNDFDQSVYNLFNEALIDMCCSINEPMQINKKTVKYCDVIDKINTLAVYNENNIDISIFMDTAITKYSEKVMTGEIKIPLSYMKACIWTAMQIGDIPLQSQIKHDGY